MEGRVYTFEKKNAKLKLGNTHWVMKKVTLVRTSTPRLELTNNQYR